MWHQYFRFSCSIYRCSSLEKVLIISGIDFDCRNLNTDSILVCLLMLQWCWFPSTINKPRSRELSPSTSLRSYRTESFDSFVTSWCTYCSGRGCVYGKFYMLIVHKCSQNYYKRLSLKYEVVSGRETFKNYSLYTYCHKRVRKIYSFF